MIDSVRTAWRDRQRYWERWGVVRGSWARRQLHPLKHAPAGTRVSFRVPGVRYPLWGRAGTADQWVYDQIFVKAELDVRLPADPGVIIDAGANVGYATTWFAARYPAARVVCLEIDADNTELLRLNVAPIGSRATILERGLWRGAARLQIENPDAESWGYRAVESRMGPIEALGVHDLLDQLGLDRVGLLKVDIEGAELEVLASAERWIDRVDALMVEPHDRYRPGCTAALAQVASRWGFSVAVAGDYHLLTR